MMRKTSSLLATQGLNALRGAATSTGSNAVTEKRYQGTAATESSGDSDKTLLYTPEEGYWRTSPFESVSVENVTLDKYIWRNFSKFENKIATVCIATGRQYTYAELRDHTAAFAVRLQNKFKLKPRDVVAICLPNLPEYPIATLGAVEAGLIVTTVNPVYTVEEIARQLIVSDTKLVIGIGKVFNSLKEACAIAKKNIPIVVIRTKTSEPLPEGAIDFHETTNTTDVDFSTLKDPGINPNEMVFLPFSSGTTGLPKGVMLSHNNITINCNQMQSKFPYETFLQQTTEDHQEVVPCVLPFFHIYGLTICMLSKIFLGVKLVTLPQFKPDDLLKALHEYKATSLNVVPPIALFLTHSPKATAEIAPRLKSVMTGAAPIGQSDVERFLKKFPHTEFCQGYGMTETSPTTIMTPNKCTKYDTIGQLIPNTDGKIVAMDECDGRGVGPNIVGELHIRGPQVMNGYFENPEANADIFRDSPSGKWLRTGDVGYYDEEGMFYITDRMKELIKVKGFQVPPAELEACLRSHPDILDAAVIGIPHDQYGEVPKGVVVLKANTKVTEEEIKEFVAGKVAHYKQLEGGVVFVKDIPKNTTGKIMRRELRTQYC